MDHTMKRIDLLALAGTLLCVLSTVITIVFLCVLGAR